MQPVAVNCAAPAESVLESELFGHKQGAFTSAVNQRKGRFELADGRTGTMKLDVRLVAATNRNLEELVAKGEFRADLYYRVSVAPIFLSPLRECRGDIPPLACEFLRRFNSEHETTLSLSDSALAWWTRWRRPDGCRPRRRDS